ncbi:hypothetical protein EYF80_024601 [Liparis tanakae]|uniref:Uncharacterized protein n=1 Tax=Liparis tanakae TaxID=230148 RepID=A0A4Z2HJU2_9TELE|nr:hypothetical protein EYF80_024601 [Liparis tanakae]
MSGRRTELNSACNRKGGQRKAPGCKHSKLAPKPAQYETKHSATTGPSGLHVTHSYSTLYELVVKKHDSSTKNEPEMHQNRVAVDITTICIVRHRALPGSMVRLRRGWNRWRLRGRALTSERLRYFGPARCGYVFCLLKTPIDPTAVSQHALLLCSVTPLKGRERKGGLQREGEEKGQGWLEMVRKVTMATGHDCGCLHGDFLGTPLPSSLTQKPQQSHKRIGGGLLCVKKDRPKGKFDWLKHGICCCFPCGETEAHSDAGVEQSIHSPREKYGSDEHGEPGTNQSIDPSTYPLLCPSDRASDMRGSDPVGEKEKKKWEESHVMKPSDSSEQGTEVGLEKAPPLPPLRTTTLIQTRAPQQLGFLLYATSYHLQRLCKTEKKTGKSGAGHEGERCAEDRRDPGRRREEGGSRRLAHGASHLDTLRGTEVCQYGQLSSNHPLKLLCGEAEGFPALHCGKRRPQPRTTLPISSGKLVYAAEWMRKTKIFSGKRKQKKVKEEVIIFERRREEVA